MDMSGFMRVKQGLLFISALVMATFTAIAWAVAPTAYSCNSCTQTQYDQAAVARARVDGQVHGFVYIYDFPGNRLLKYETGREPGTNGQWDYWVVEASPAAEQYQYFALAREAWDLNGRNVRSLKAAVEYPPVSVTLMNGLPTRARDSEAYGVVLSSAQQNDFSDCIKRDCFNPAPMNATVISNILGLLGSMSTIAFKDNPVGFRVVIVLANGSRVTFEWNPPDARPVLTEAIDANGNRIPLTREQFEHPAPPYGDEYDFSHDHGDLNNFVHYAEMRGARIQIDQIGSNWIVGCVIMGTEHICRQYPR